MKTRKAVMRCEKHDKELAWIGNRSECSACAAEREIKLSKPPKRQAWADRSQPTPARKEHKHNYDSILKGCDTCEPQPTPAAHSPLPLTDNIPTMIEGCKVMTTLDDVLYASNVEAKTSAFIVRAVNAHESLLTQLKQMHNHYQGSDMQLINGKIAHGYTCRTCEAIAKAEGK